MLVLIDESGDPGFKIAQGSTTHFVVAMVIFYDFKEAERASEIIKKALKDLKVKPEFKFSKSSDWVRDGFFTALAGCDFRVSALVVDKERIYSPNLRNNDEMFYNYFIQLLLKHDNGQLKGASIKIDGSGDREFKRELNQYLRKQVEEGKVAKIKFADSHRDVLIQLADMVAGAIARSYRTDRSDHDKWRKMLSKKIENVWDFK